MPSITIMCGLPASGKTTIVNSWAYKDDIILHRDEFRANLRHMYHSDEYFPVSAAEEYDLWIDTIVDAMEYLPECNVWIDQTTLSEGSALKLINRLNEKVNLKRYTITFLIVHTATAVCFGRNSMREGFERVPDHVMRSMADSFNMSGKVIKRMPKELQLQTDVVYVGG